MSHSLCSKVMRLLGNPYTTLSAGIFGGLACCISLLRYYYPNNIDPSLSDSGLSEKMSSPEFLNACLVSMAIGGILLFDLLLDVSSFLIDYRSTQRELEKTNHASSVDKLTAEKENSIELLKEFLLRFLFIICVLVSSISIWKGRSEYRCILGYFAIRFRDIVHFSACMFSVVDTFHDHGVFLKWFCLACRYQPTLIPS